VSEERLDDAELLTRDAPAELLDHDTSALPLGPDDGFDSYTRRDLMREERAIAMHFHGGTMWPYVVMTVTGLALWLSLFPLALMGMLSPWGLAAAFCFATFWCAYGFMPSHEAMHSNIVGQGERHYWVNELVGFLSTIPLALGFGVARLTHMEHHAHTNDPQLDPDINDGAPSAFRAVLKTWWNRQPGVKGSTYRYRQLMNELDTPASRRASLETMLLQLVMFGTLFAMAWSGFAIEAALIWWLPRHLGLSWIRYWLSWAPHHPQPRGRYANTRIFKTRWGFWASMGMEFHAIHHLYPKIPNHRTKHAYFALKDVLTRRGMDVSAH
jgi:beta-carotene hydroxylase